jgi:hypothetical protein
MADEQDNMECPECMDLLADYVDGALPRHQAELVFRKGLEHEDAYLRRLEAEGKTVRTIEIEPDHDWERAARETIEASLRLPVRSGQRGHRGAHRARPARGGRRRGGLGPVDHGSGLR